MELTDAEIARLVGCSKTITDAPRREMLEENGHRRNDFKCTATDGDERFRVFMRQNSTYADSFSVGLAYFLPEGGEIILVRCNGPHGEVVDDPMEGSASPHFGFHIHHATEDNISNARLPEAGGTITTEYGTFEDAMAYFVQLCGITDADKCFPHLGNPTLF
ncbi:MAG: hypothetical protein M1617_05110 [Actinobacteria bacterium]|nr:hypothetical protein [Actinomycetota bacterium]MCL5887664.1 hypothetical protein [Actinomycetota bacterium]